MDGCGRRFKRFVESLWESCESRASVSGAQTATLKFQTIIIISTVSISFPLRQQFMNIHSASLYEEGSILVEPPGGGEHRVSVHIHPLPRDGQFSCLNFSAERASLRMLLRQPADASCSTSSEEPIVSSKYCPAETMTPLKPERSTINATAAPLATHRHDTRMVHRNAVVGVRGELVQRESRGAVHGLVVRVEVGDERPHGVQHAKLVAVVVPAAAVGDGRRQVLPE